MISGEGNDWSSNQILIPLKGYPGNHCTPWNKTEVLCHPAQRVVLHRILPSGLNLSGRTMGVTRGSNLLLWHFLTSLVASPFPSLFARYNLSFSLIHTHTHSLTLRAQLKLIINWLLRFGKFGGINTYSCKITSKFLLSYWFSDESEARRPCCWASQAGFLNCLTSARFHPSFFLCEAQVDLFCNTLYLHRSWILNKGLFF